MFVLYMYATVTMRHVLFVAYVCVRDECDVCALRYCLR